MISKKIILTGSFGVGKTSLFNRFIYQQFSDKYLTTIGVKVNNKTIKIDDESISMMVWDIAGEVLQDKVPASYFLGASGIIYVMDLSRPLTFMNLESDIQFLRDLLPNGTIIIVANKKDLVTDEQFEMIRQESPRPFDYTTSAKTGENVEELFIEMGKRLLHRTPNT
jgi:small GTP-binding protein